MIQRSPLYPKRGPLTLIPLFLFLFPLTFGTFCYCVILFPSGSSELGVWSLSVLGWIGGTSKKKVLCLNLEVKWKQQWDGFFTVYSSQDSPVWIITYAPRTFFMQHCFFCVFSPLSLASTWLCLMMRLTITSSDEVCYAAAAQNRGILTTLTKLSLEKHN